MGLEAPHPAYLGPNSADYSQKYYKGIAWVGMRLMLGSQCQVRQVTIITGHNLSIVPHVFWSVLAI